VFKRLCLPCHDIGANAKVKLGPPLNGVDVRKSGTYEAFNYSPANKNSGITWDHDAFAKYIRAPMQEMPGTRMAFVGIKNDKDIAASNLAQKARRSDVGCGRRGIASAPLLRHGTRREQRRNPPASWSRR
jgi:hypothetical protein